MTNKNLENSPYKQSPKLLAPTALHKNPKFLSPQMMSMKSKIDPKFNTSGLPSMSNTMKKGSMGSPDSLGSELSPGNFVSFKDVQSKNSTFKSTTKKGDKNVVVCYEDMKDGYESDHSNRSRRSRAS